MWRVGQHYKQTHSTVSIQIMVAKLCSQAKLLLSDMQGVLAAMRKISVHAGIWISTKSCWHLSNPNCSLLWCWIPSTLCNGPLVWLSARTRPEAHTCGGRWLIQLNGSKKKSWDASCILDIRGEGGMIKWMYTEKSYFKILVWETCHRWAWKLFYWCN